MIVEEGAGQLYNRSGGRPAGHHLDERNDVRRIEPVNDQEALVAADRVDHVLGRDRGASGGDDRLGRHPDRYAPEDVALEIDELPQCLLDEPTAAETVQPAPLIQ